MGRNFVFGCVLVYFLYNFLSFFSIAFKTKSGITKNYGNGTTDTSFYSYFSRDLSDIKNSQKIVPLSRKTVLKFLISNLNSKK